jgi:hypothetical protein
MKGGDLMKIKVIKKGKDSKPRWCFWLAGL